MRQEFRGTIQSGSFSLCACQSRVLRVPVDDDGGEEVQSGHAIMLRFGSAVADFALPTDAQSVFQGVMRFAFVEADLGAALHIGIEQPLDAACRANSGRIGALSPLVRFQW